jgi:calcium-dependent protein kinase
MDYDNHPNLLEFKDLTVEEIKLIIYQLLDTIAYIHSCNICHRDIKPDNILYDRANKNIKVVDFGISKNFSSRGNKEMLTITGTLYYQAPEIFIGGGYDEKVDVWATGITFYQLVTGKTPF